MADYYGDFAEDETVYIPFNTFDSNDPSASVTITNLAAADIKVHKDGSLTQIVTDGATVIIDFDSITGNHLITIDTSADAAYTTGTEYQVRIEGTTIDAATINAWVGSFSIERTGGAIALLTGTNSLANIEDKIDIIDTVVDAIPTTAMRGTDNAALASVCTEVRLQTLTDWINGGRLDLLLDAIPTTAMRGTDSAALASVCTETRLQALTDWLNGGRLDLLLDAIPTTAMRGTDSAALASVCTETRLQALTDWLNGGRLDLLLDAIPTTAMRGTDSALLASSINTTAGAIDNVTTVATTTANTDMRGTDSANTVVPDAAGTAPTVVEILTTQMTEAYAADGVAPTLAQALFLIQQALTEFAIAGTSNTVKRLNGSTTAAVMTLDDASDPTSSTRSS